MNSDWRIAAASVAGTSHERTGAPCQDSHLAALVGDDGSTLVLIASDGAGSASHSEIGSSLACSRLMEELRRAIDQGLEVAQITKEVALGWLSQVRAALQAAADEHDLGLREFACTLLAAVLSPTHSAFFQVGDGAMVVRPNPTLNPQKHASPPFFGVDPKKSPPDPGEVLDTEKWSIGDSNS